MAHIIITRRAQLSTAVNTESLPGLLYAGENDAHVFIISAVRGDTPVTLAGAVTALFIRPDESTVALSGEIVNGCASVTLPQSCYTQTGRFQLTVFVTENDVKTAVYCLTGNVKKTSTETIIDPGHVVPDISDIIAEYATMQQAVEDCEDAAEAANTAATAADTAAANVAGAIADAYSATSTYVVGDYCTKDGKLYRCVTAISTAEAWTAAHWTEVQTMDEVETIDNLLQIEKYKTTSYDGYNSSNNTNAIPTTSPFVLVSDSFDYTGCLVCGIKLNVSLAGSLSIGVIKKADVAAGELADRTKATVKDTVTFSSTGVTDITLEHPFAVASDEYIFIATPTDTCKWKYGVYGTDTRFAYVVPDTGNWYISVNSVGIAITVYKSAAPSNVREICPSIYNGKSLSILGDSISTFSGYIPEGNVTYYPTGTVQAVTDTWWKKLIDALGMTLNVNNSWSGSRVTTTAGDTSAGCMTRCQSLGTTPDVIIVWMGINDFNNEVALGEYDGSTAIPSTTTTFREAYGIMLNKILTAYPAAEVWVCTLPQCERNGSEGFPEINGNGVALAAFNKAIRELADAFGVKVLEHNKCGLTYQNMDVYNPDELHPNKFGHSLVANNDIWQMDGVISKRYPLS